MRGTRQKQWWRGAEQQKVTGSLQPTCVFRETKDHLDCFPQFMSIWVAQKKRHNSIIICDFEAQKRVTETHTFQPGDKHLYLHIRFEGFKKIMPAMLLDLVTLIHFLVSQTHVIKCSLCTFMDICVRVCGRRYFFPWNYKKRIQFFPFRNNVTNSLAALNFFKLNRRCFLTVMLTPSLQIVQILAVRLLKNICTDHVCVCVCVFLSIFLQSLDL